MPTTLKCDQCRKDKQKCIPIERSWPREKCDRRLKYGYLCSASSTWTRPREPRISNCPPHDNSTINVPSVTPRLNSFEESSHISQLETRPKCAQNFSGLINSTVADWMSLGSDEVAKKSCPVLHDTLSVMDARRSRMADHSNREYFCDQIADSLGLSPTNLSTYRPFLKKTGVAMLLNHVARSGGKRSTLPADELIMHLKDSVHHGHLWKLIILAAGAKEVLLMDDMGSWLSHEEYATKDYFESMDLKTHRIGLKLLSYKENDIDATVMKLDGLVDMIDELRRLRLDSPLLPRLAEEIHCKIRMAFGRPPGDPDQKSIDASRENDEEGSGRSSDEYNATLGEEDCRVFRPDDLAFLM